MLRTTLIFVLVVAGIAPAFAAEDNVDKVNGSITVSDGDSKGKLSTVNGGIRVGSKAHARSAATVNGGIDVDSGATVDSLETVNGGIKVGGAGKVGANVTTVNGSITLESNADVGGKVSNVNGGIRLEAAHVGGGIETANGDITVGANSRVEGGIFIDANSGFHWGTPRKPRIVIGPHATVQGKLTFRREVELYVSDSATIGPVDGATVQKFGGDRPDLQ